ncbi:hypothetical protein [Anabaena sp. CCY 9402-a]|uniref:hypothetical protein n=1 Tax=Anabaena sp. CCY 9402-a TaxID=3103867 RepID=UPI0039C6ED5E
MTLMNKEKLLKHCLTRITQLGIPTEQYLTGEYFGLNTHKLANGLWEVWIILEWNEHPTNWACRVKCLVSGNLQIQQYCLLTKKLNGSIIEHFRYP